MSQLLKCLVCGEITERGSYSFKKRGEIHRRNCKICGKNTKHEVLRGGFFGDFNV